MAQKKTTTASSQPTVEELRMMYASDQRQKENFAKGQAALKKLKDINGRDIIPSVPTMNRDKLRNYFVNVSSYTTQFREAARYLYYRSNVFFRIVFWYTSMWDLGCRKLTPNFNLVKSNNDKKILKSFNDTADQLDLYNLKYNLVEAFLNVYTEDLFFGCRYTDDTGTIIIKLDQENCKIDGQYMTGDYSFALNMAAYRSAAKQKWIEYMGEPFVSMYKAYEETNERWQHFDDKYAVCLKFDTKDLDIIVPPLARLMLQLSALEDNVDVQAVADELSIYKLVYLPLETLNSAKESDDFKVSPEMAVEYFNRILNDALPDYVSGGVIPGSKLETIDFSQSADNDINRVQNSIDNIFATSGGGAVLNTRNMTTNAQLKLWIQEETAFAMSTLMPQVNGLANRLLSYDVNNPCHVEHFMVSRYTKDDFAKQLLESCQYSYSNRLAYNTCLGISEKQTIASDYLENTLLKLPEIMIYPLQSSHTISSSDNTVGRPQKDDGDLSPEGERSRNR